MNALPERHRKFADLLASCDALDPIPMAVVHPCDESAIGGAVAAAQRGLIAPVLVGPAARIAMFDVAQNLAIARQFVGHSRRLIEGQLASDNKAAAGLDE